MSTATERGTEINSQKLTFYLEGNRQTDNSGYRVLIWGEESHYMSEKKHQHHLPDDGGEGNWQVAIVCARSDELNLLIIG